MQQLRMHPICVLMEHMKSQITEIPIGQLTVRIETQDSTSYIEEYEQLQGPSLPIVHIAGKEITSEYINAVVDNYFDGTRMLVLSLRITGPIQDRVIDDTSDST